jgi:signal transduction histidine kinase
MINTIADNARKFTPQGGTVTIEARQEPDYV